MVREDKEDEIGEALWMRNVFVLHIEVHVDMMQRYSRIRDSQEQ